MNDGLELSQLIELMEAQVGALASVLEMQQAISAKLDQNVERDAVLAALLESQQTIIETLDGQGKSINGLAARVEQHHEAVSAALDSQSQTLAAMATVLGFVHLGDPNKWPLPASALNDAAFSNFLERYPIDGPPIVGKEAMDKLTGILDSKNPASMAATFKALEDSPLVGPVERIRNRQIESYARQRFGDLDAIAKGHAVPSVPSAKGMDR